MNVSVVAQTVMDDDALVKFLRSFVIRYAWRAKSAPVDVMKLPTGGEPTFTEGFVKFVDMPTREAARNLRIEMDDLFAMLMDLNIGKDESPKYDKLMDILRGINKGELFNRVKEEISSLLPRLARRMSIINKFAMEILNGYKAKNNS